MSGRISRHFDLTAENARYQMDRSHFNQLETKYGQHASWTIWRPDDLEDTAVIRENLGDLKTSVVMVALNISGAISSPWQNFHSRDHARKLMYAFNQSPYRGSYITDLIKDHVESSSERLRSHLVYFVRRAGHQDVQYLRCEDISKSNQLPPLFYVRQGLH